MYFGGEGLSMYKDDSSLSLETLFGERYIKTKIPKMNNEISIMIEINM